MRDLELEELKEVHGGDPDDHDHWDHDHDHDHDHP